MTISVIYSLLQWLQAYSYICTYAHTYSKNKWAEIAMKSYNITQNTYVKIIYAKLK